MAWETLGLEMLGAPSSEQVRLAAAEAPRAGRSRGAHRAREFVRCRRSGETARRRGPDLQAL